jgi:hypothetical protein
MRRNGFSEGISGLAKFEYENNGKLLKINFSLSEGIEFSYSPTVSGGNLFSKLETNSNYPVDRRYEYDSGRNPFLFWNVVNWDNIFNSKNNPTKETIILPWGQSSVISEYEYDEEGYPVNVTKEKYTSQFQYPISISKISYTY